VRPSDRESIVYINTIDQDGQKEARNNNNNNNNAAAALQQRNREWCAIGAVSHLQTQNHQHLVGMELRTRLMLSLLSPIEAEEGIHPVNLTNNIPDTNSYSGRCCGSVSPTDGG
jgi:hypothetical protein